MAQTKEPVKTYVLQDPIELKDEKIYQLEFRELKAIDHIQVEKENKDAGWVTKGCAYLQRLTGLGPTIIGELSHRDYLECQDILLDFLEKGPRNTTTT